MKKLIHSTLAMLLALSMLSTSVFAATFDYAHNKAESSDNYYNLVSKTDWDIAPGITETEIVLNNAAGDRRQVVHMMQADISNPYTRVISSYTKMDTSNYAISTIPEHAAYIEEEWGENVVGAMNTCLSWYNSAAYAQDPSRVNEPLGFMMVDGEVYFDHSVGFPTCIVIHKDVNDNGETRPADIPKVEMRTVNSSADLNGWENQIIPSSSGYIVKDGVNQYKSDHGTGTAARSVVGVKADGSIVIMMNDGRQAPYSLGMTMYECAEVMIAAGCVYASNCDGGGSSTFMSQRPGRDLEVNCNPCDGSLRQNTHGIMFISTAPATGEFYNAFLQTENDYFAPTSTVEVQAIGRDFSGAEAEIPADAVWSLADDSFGTVEDGVFVSNGKTGDVVINLNYNGAVVGSKTIHIVNPETVAFSQSSTVIPYGKSVVLDIVASYGEFNVVYDADDFTWTLSDEEAGTRNGLTFTAGSDASKTGVKVTATYKHADLGSTTLDISFGKGSEILYDFEDRDISKWLGIDAATAWAKTHSPDSPLLDDSPLAGQFTEGNDSTTFLATADNGKVKNGKYALGVELDYTHSGSFGQWSYDMFFNVEGQTVLRDTANGMNATRLGMWIYIPEELAPGHNLAMQTELYCGSSSTNYVRKNTHLVLECNGKTLTQCSEADIPEDRWVYCYMDLTPYNYVSLQNPYTALGTRREPQFIRFYTQSKEPFNAVFYFDDITLDYSDAVDDRNAPIINDILVSTSGTTIRSFTAKVADYSASNASGLDYRSAKIFVDGVALGNVRASGSIISSPDVTLLPGTHTVTFEIADNKGNVTKESQDFTVEGTAPVTFSGHNDLNNVPQYDSVYYADIKVTDIETIKSLTADIYLNFANTWELDHMIVADGFEATYSIDEYHNVATINVTKTGSTDTGVATLVSIPVRLWSWDAEGAGFDSADIGANSYPKVIVKADVRKGYARFTDGTSGAFNGALNVASALTEAVAPSGWHTHTEEASDDADATCTTVGYAGRTYCYECGSVIKWGTTLEPIGHSFTVEADGLYTCEECENTYFYIDGKEQKGWVEFDGKCYYLDSNGNAVNGECVIDGHTYVFEDYTLTDAAWEHDGTGLTAWWAGQQVTGSNTYESKWKTFNGKKYYFTGIYAATGLTQVKISTDVGYKYYIFGDDGAWLENHTGLYEGTYKGKIGTYYAENGICVYKGLVLVDGSYYYINSSFTAVKSQTYYVSRTNDLLPAGEYSFDENGKMINPPMGTPDPDPNPDAPTTKNGIYEEGGKLYYYEDNVKVAKGLYKDEATGNYYCFGVKYYAIGAGEYWFNEEKLNGLLDPYGNVLKPGFYTVNADCTVHFEEPKNGIYEEGGKLYYYEDNVKVAKGLYKDEATGNYYCFGVKYYAIGAGEYWFNEEKLNGLLDPYGNVLKPGFYTVNADCTVHFEEPKNGIYEEGGKLYYYEDNVKVAKGLYKDEATGNYYCFGVKYYAIGAGEYWFNEEKLNGLTGPDGEELKPGFYTVNADCTVQFK